MPPIYNIYKINNSIMTIHRLTPIKSALSAESITSPPFMHGKKRKDVTLHVFTSFLPRGNLYSCPLINQQLFHVVGKTHIDAGTFLL